MVKVTIYVEGGGDRRDLKTKCRQGFISFFEKAGLKGRMPALVACGGRQQAFDKFQTAFKAANPDEFIILLIDSEDPIKPGHAGKPWAHLKARKDDRFDPPPGATDEHAHLMVQCMEAWFMADRKALATYFHPGFHEPSLPNEAEKIECIARDRLSEALKEASEKSSKGKYAKGKHSFAILASIDPDLVRKASHHADRFLVVLESKLMR